MLCRKCALTIFAKPIEKIAASESLLQQSRRHKNYKLTKKETPAQASSRESREPPRTAPYTEHLGGCLQKDIRKKACNPIYYYY